ncbi:hypothetical protein H5410_000397 [Solanum commersonii]|uniref:Uncharacterized protein n=1 Tax=Solanum commersonii TaxID=4109 RepID=A0A9J6AW13_SOLCO|nr:hypothetical protein H5410_000397 [Solanum commersonii]
MPSNLKKRPIHQTSLKARYNIQSDPTFAGFDLLYPYPTFLIGFIGQIVDVHHYVSTKTRGIVIFDLLVNAFTELM